jgi:hypothetical protein
MCCCHYFFLQITLAGCIFAYQRFLFEVVAKKKLTRIIFKWVRFVATTCRPAHSCFMEWRKTKAACFHITVSSAGHICFEGKFVRQSKSLYRQVRLRHTNFKVHRLVAKAFCTGYKKGHVVNHKDGNKWNNRADNLEYCTSVENIQHAHRIGLCKRKPKETPPAQVLESLLAAWRLENSRAGTGSGRTR